MDDDIAQIKDDVAHVRAVVDRLVSLNIAVLQGEKIMALDLTALKASVDKNRTVTASALVLIQGIKSKIDEAIAAALAAGATPEELAQIKALSVQIESDDDALAAAVAANTPAAPPTP